MPSDSTLITRAVLAGALVATLPGAAFATTPSESAAAPEVVCQSIAGAAHGLPASSAHTGAVEPTMELRRRQENSRKS